jgi:hypothetical protein
MLMIVQMASQSHRHAKSVTANNKPAIAANVGFAARPLADFDVQK